jgi:hypothetical protein
MNIPTVRLLGCWALALTAGSPWAQVTPATPAARFFSLDPWCEREADRLRSHLNPREPLQLEGLGHDWLVGAMAIQSPEATGVTVDLEGPLPLRAAANLKAVGEMRGSVRDTRGHLTRTGSTGRISLRPATPRKADSGNDMTIP